MKRRVAVDLTVLRDSRNLRLLTIGELFSGFGTQATLVAIPYQVYTLTHSAALVGLLGVVELIPIIIGSLLGTLVSAFGVTVPAIVMDPVQLIADAAVPVLLISYGISLHGQRVLGAQGHRRDVILAGILKLIAMPIIAWGAALLFGLSAEQTLIVVVLAALPTAQNVFNYSQRYDIGEAISRDTVFLTTIGCLPVLLLVMTLLG
jgi:predicted permease